MNYLEIAKQMADELDFVQPTTLQGSLSTEHRRMKNNINRAYNLVRLKINKKNENAETTGTITTVGGTEAYDFPVGLLKIYALIGVDDTTPIEIIPWQEYLSYKADTLTITQTGSPDKATIFQRKVYFYPIPDTAYTIDVYGYDTLVELSDDADEPDLPDEFHRVIFEFALYYQMHYEGNPAAPAQQAIAYETLNAVKANMKGSWVQPPRIRSVHELQRESYLRRIIR